MTIRDWPPDERPREKLLARGAQALTDAELVAVFLKSGRPGRHAVDVARDLLLHVGGVRALLAADSDRLREVPGLGPAKVATLKAAAELGRRALGETLKRGCVIGSPTDARDYLHSRLRDLGHEVFYGLFLDQRHRVLALEELFAGSLSEAPVYPREIVKRALALNAAAVIFAHNHPSGEASPSEADRVLTRRLTAALATVEIRVLDHLVVGDREVTSLSEEGGML